MSGDKEGWQGEEELGRAQGIFRTGKLFYMKLKCWILAIVYLSKPIECSTLRMNTDIKTDGGGGE